MPDKTSGPNLYQQVGPGIGTRSAAVSVPEYRPNQLLKQPPLDIVAILAARSGVSTISIKAQLDVWQIGSER